MKQNKKILIVEDSKEMRKVLTSALHNDDITVLEAGNGEEGLAKALAEHPDLILLDVVMPKIDGITMLKKLREDAWGKNAQVMILTNLSDAEKVNAAMSEGVYDFLVKGNWSLEDLVGKVRRKLQLDSGDNNDEEDKKD